MGGGLLRYCYVPGGGSVPYSCHNVSYAPVVKRQLIDWSTYGLKLWEIITLLWGGLPTPLACDNIFISSLVFLCTISTRHLWTDKSVL